MAYEVMEISVINDDNIVGWAAGMLRVGELYMSSVDTMVTVVLNKVGSNGLIERLNIMDHGNEDEIKIGNDILTVANLAQYEANLAKLAPKFSGEGFVHLQHCNIGQNQLLLKRLAKIFKVPVYAGTGAHNPLYRFNTGEYIVCFPGGSCRTPVPRP